MNEMRRVGIQIWAIVALALLRIWHARGRYLAIAFGVLVATTLVCSIVLYA